MITAKQIVTFFCGSCVMLNFRQETESVMTFMGLKSGTAKLRSRPYEFFGSNQGLVYFNALPSPRNEGLKTLLGDLSERNDFVLVANESCASQTVFSNSYMVGQV